MISVSIVVPARNEEDLLPACLEALTAQDYLGPLEIIVVDNGSTDRTLERVRRFDVNVVSEPRHGYVHALARGFAAVTGEIVATTDADTVVPRHWVSRLVREYEDHPDVVAVGGDIDFQRPNWKAWIFTKGILPIVSRIDRNNPAGAHLWGANFSVLREAFQRVGGWDVTVNLQTDTEISERLRRLGRVVLLKDLPVSTSCRRWNRSFVSSVLLYVSNLASLQITKRPLWWAFPEIRERPPASAARGTVWKTARAGALATALTGLAVLVGYDTFAPWSDAFGKTYWEATTAQRVVALTFDDGPNEPFTSGVLDILAREQVKATFFLIGMNARLYPQVASRIAREGHAIGNHSDSHPPGFALEPTQYLRSEVNRAEESIHAVTGVYPRFFRPPQGIRSPWLMRVLEQDSLITVTWDDAPGDWEPYSANHLVQATVARAHPGAIILLHDGLNLAHPANRSATLAALPRVIEQLRAEGYRFVTIPELLGDPPGLSRWPAAQSTRRSHRGV